MIRRTFLKLLASLIGAPAVVKPLAATPEKGFITPAKFKGPQKPKKHYQYVYPHNKGCGGIAFRMGHKPLACEPLSSRGVAMPDDTPMPFGSMIKCYTCGGLLKEPLRRHNVIHEIYFHSPVA